MWDPALVSLDGPTCPRRTPTIALDVSATSDSIQVLPVSRPLLQEYVASPADRTIPRHRGRSCLRSHGMSITAASPNLALTPASSPATTATPATPHKPGRGRIIQNGCAIDPGTRSAATVRLADLLVVREFSHRAVSQVVLQAGVPELINGTCLPEDTTLVGVGQEARECPRQPPGQHEPATREDYPLAPSSVAQGHADTVYESTANPQHNSPDRADGEPDNQSHRKPDRQPKESQQK